MTAEHHTLFYSCALSLLREYKGRARFYIATDLPDKVCSDPPPAPSLYLPYPSSLWSRAVIFLTT